MPMTLAEKILARASGNREVAAGDYVTAKIDVAMAHEGASWVIDELMRAGIDKVWDSERIVILFDHWAPAPTELTATMHKKVREFVKRHKIKHFYDIKAGICHQIMPEMGHVRPGELIVGTDSHTTTYGAFGAGGTGLGTTDMAVVFVTGELWFRVPETIKFQVDGSLPKYVTSKDVILKIAGKYGTEVAQYKSVEFEGSAIRAMSLASRMTLSNMTMEIGAKFALIAPDDKTISYVKSRTTKPFTPMYPDPDASYEKVYELNVSDLEPQVAFPHSVDNVKPVSEAEGVKVDQALIGSCTNGRLEDLAAAAEILKNRKVHPDVRLIVIPASREVYLEALRAGIIETLLEAGAVVCNPTCGPCMGTHLGLLAEGERCISSSNRNFKGRMGSSKSEIYLASPYVVAASAVRGEITDPRKLMEVRK
ncbi:MAG: 3-isopropylmalate dehydratase large subunit [Candidatus Nezhaarchaeota archaeon]|nr:3-isopropylmalate dehydratase large subunit [Candidatus Nezhaarchaeota archaeon]